MTERRYPYRPVYAIPPGWVLEDHIRSKGISPGELARNCGISLELVNGIIAREAPIDPETAAKLSRVLGVGASIWLGIEADYQAFIRS